MLRSRLRQILGAANAAVRCRRVSGSEPEERLKCGHRLPATIVPKHEFIEIDLQLRLADAVISADQPLLQVADGAISHRHDRGDAATELAAARLLSRALAGPWWSA